MFFVQYLKNINVPKSPQQYYFSSSQNRIMKLLLGDFANQVADAVQGLSATTNLFALTCTQSFDQKERFAGFGVSNTSLVVRRIAVQINEIIADKGAKDDANKPLPPLQAIYETFTAIAATGSTPQLVSRAREREHPALAEAVCMGALVFAAKELIRLLAEVTDVVKSIATFAKDSTAPAIFQEAAVQLVTAVVSVMTCCCIIHQITLTEADSIVNGRNQQDIFHQARVAVLSRAGTDFRVYIHIGTFCNLKAAEGLCAFSNAEDQKKKAVLEDVSSDEESNEQPVSDERGETLTEALASSAKTAMLGCEDLEDVLVYD